jgi:hypothetical protein
MSTRIEDGTGSGNFASVTSLKQLSVQSESVPSEGYQAQLNRSFIVHAECHTAAAASGGLMIITNNDQDYDLEISRIYIDACVLTPADLIVTQEFDATGASGTDVSSTAVIQKNKNSNATFNLTVKVSDSSADLTLSGGTQYHRFAMPTKTSQQRDMKGTNIIPSNSSIAWGWKTAGGGSATDGEIVSLSVNVIKRERT